MKELHTQENLSGDKILEIQESIVKKVTSSNDKNVINKEYSVDVYNKDHSLRLPMIFMDILNKQYKKLPKDEDQIQREQEE
mmetsp:Transcript_748/g.620  ORF Transcript_748/g.620 Transcript_748/m.620 type:complete len:81 (+) Transcript_748:469-711(+)